MGNWLIFQYHLKVRWDDAVSYVVRADGLARESSRPGGLNPSIKLKVSMTLPSGRGN